MNNGVTFPILTALISSWLREAMFSQLVEVRNVLVLKFYLYSVFPKEIVSELSHDQVHSP